MEILNWTNYLFHLLSTIFYIFYTLPQAKYLFHFLRIYFSQMLVPFFMPSEARQFFEGHKIYIYNMTIIYNYLQYDKLFILKMLQPP